MPKKKTGEHLQFYMDCMNNGCQMPNDLYSMYKGGLCKMANIGYISNELLKLFSDGMSDYDYWACSDGQPYESRFNFNSLRQTIVLFMAAINNEL
jgi:hypothetical protein